MTYTPNYIPGKIVVKFRDEDALHGDFEEQFGKILGYKYEGQVFGGASLFTLPIGQEEQAMKTLSSQYKKFVQWTELYDEKLDSRFNSVEGLGIMVRELYDTADSDDKFQSNLDNLIAYIINLKK